MAYVHDTRYSTLGSVGTSEVTPPLSDHVEDDIVFLSLWWDEPTGTTLSVSGAGWTTLTNAQANGTRHTVVYATAGASPLTAPTFTHGGAAENYSCASVTVRDADTADIIEDWSVNAGLDVRTSTAISTANANVLSLFLIVRDFASGLRCLPLDVASAVLSEKSATETNVVLARHFPGTGTVPAITGALSANTTGGTSVVHIAINNKSGGKHQPRLLQLGKLLTKHGDNPGPSSSSLSAIAATIGGQTVVDATNLTNTSSGSSWAVYGGMTCSTTAPATRYLGLLYDVEGGSTDMTVGPITLETTSFSLNTFDGPVLLILADASNNWSAFQMWDGTTVKASDQAQKSVVVDVSAASPLYSSTTPATLTAVTKVGVAALHDKVQGTYNSSLRWTSMILWDVPLTFVGNNTSQPWSLPAVSDFVLVSDLTGPGLERGGASQVYSTVPVQFGDGSTQTTVDLSLVSYEMSVDSRFRNTPGHRCELRIKASASDSYDLRYSLIAGVGPNKNFVIDAASSGSATFLTSGLAMVGIGATLQSGFTVNGVLFSGCYLVDTNGATLTDCRFLGSVGAVAVKTGNPAVITDCAFVSNGSGHAIEITQPGTYTFGGNTFSGYGADGTTDAAIYNNSGGLVTLNVTGGGDTPTVRNGTEASTTVNSGATLTLTGLEPGSDIVILDAGTTTERVNVDANAGTSYAYNYTATGSVDIGVFKVGFVPLYIRGFTLTTSDASLPIDQIPDRNYANP